ncbi:hypothetical protein B4Q13_24445, partial [Lacticaseibacillus rhamnosus]
LELAKNDNDERLSLINRSAGNIHNAIHEIRNISRSLVPASIGDLGLQDSIIDLVESVKTTRAIHVEFYPVGNFDEKISASNDASLIFPSPAQGISYYVASYPYQFGSGFVVITATVDDT